MLETAYTFYFAILKYMERSHRCLNPLNESLQLGCAEICICI